MKLRLWGIMVGVAAFILLSTIIDQPFQPAMRHLPPTATSTPATTVEYVLQGCDASYSSYVGPLVPNQDTPPAVTQASSAKPTEVVQAKVLSHRAGFSISTPTDPVYWAHQLGSGWYLDWSTQQGIFVAGPEHWQMVRVHQECITPAPQVIQSTAAGYPGQVWIIGNEPDVIWQDNVTPEKYAIFYHDLYRLIKTSDPTALIAVGGIAQATPLRLQYLDHVLETYQDLYHETMPVDWWTVHGYVLREQKNSWGVEIPPGSDATQGMLYEVSDHGRLDLFEDQIRTFRRWMAENGYLQTPLALTEFGILMPNSYGFPPEMISDYLDQTFTWLDQARDPSTGYPQDDYRLVQKWAWFSITDPNYPSSNLADLSSDRLTIIGERFQNVVSFLHP